MSGACSSPEQAHLSGTRSGARPGSVRLLCGDAALAALVPQWEDLAANAIEPNAFYEHWSLRPALQAYAGTDNVACAAVWIEGRLVGVFPFERVRRWRGLPVSALRSWRHRNCVLATPLVRAGYAPACLVSLLDWVREECEVAVVEFDYVAADGPFQAALLDALAARDLSSFAMDGFTRALLVKQESADAYIQGSLNNDFRKDLRRRVRRLDEQGKVARVELQPGGDLAGWLDEFLALEAKGWKGANGTALKCRPDDLRFATGLFAAAFARGSLLALGIDLDGKPLARLCGITAGEGSFVFKTAYDEDYSRFSPGVMVELDWIRRIHALPGIRWTDSFTSPGNEMMKKLWKDRRTIHRISVGVGARGELAVAAIPLLRFFKRILRKR